MKIVLLFGLGLTGFTAYAQPKEVSMATVNITTTIVAPEGEDVSNIQNQGDGRMNFRNFGDGETKSVIYIKNDLVKTVAKSDVGRTTTIRDNKTKLTTTLLEIMGNKTGFYATDEEQEQAKKSMDSMMSARPRDSSARQAPRPAGTSTVDFVETNETKKIAGYLCKKAYLITTRLMILKDTAIVWYNPDFKVPNFTPAGAAGAIASFMNPSTTSNGMEKVDGFIMGYETKMRRNRTMIMEVTKVDFTKEVADKEFNIPKDFDVKPMKEMRNQMSGTGGMQFQMRRNN